MPKDQWQRARHQTVARHVKFEIATGKPLSYEFLSDEITPLDRINVFDRAEAHGGFDLKPPNGMAPELIPKVGRSRRPDKSVRFTPATGVSVLVEIEAKSQIGVVQALEAALTRARNSGRYPLPKAFEP